MKLCGAVAAAAAVAMLLPANANAMSVADFLAKADALKSRGLGAMFSSDIGLLKAEIAAASSAYRASSASKRPRSCPPPKGTVKMDSDELLKAFRAVPANQRASMNVSTAFSDHMVQRFPCR